MNIARILYPKVEKIDFYYLTFLSDGCGYIRVRSTKWGLGYNLYGRNAGYLDSHIKEYKKAIEKL